MEENQQPSKKFTILNQDDQFKWVLPDDMAKCANSHFNQYIPEQEDLKQSLLTGNPVPLNIRKIKRLDEFMSHLLKENNQTSVCTLETTLEKIQKKNIDLTGPLSELWHAFERATTSPDDEVDITNEDLLNLVLQTALLVRQPTNTISYHRRLSVLAGAMKSSS